VLHPGSTGRRRNTRSPGACRGCPAEATSSHCFQVHQVHQVDNGPPCWRRSVRSRRLTSPAGAEIPFPGVQDPAPFLVTGLNAEVNAITALGWGTQRHINQVGCNHLHVRQATRTHVGIDRRRGSVSGKERDSGAIRWSASACAFSSRPAIKTTAGPVTIERPGGGTDENLRLPTARRRRVPDQRRLAGA
jgi:hypothetical protein